MADLDNTFTHSRVIAVKNDNALLTIQLFPNPVSDVLQVQIPSVKKETVTARITDATGRSVYVNQLPLAEGNNATSIPVQQLPTGTYYLVIDAKAGRQSRKFIKQ
jgi:hypothetical protein